MKNTLLNIANHLSDVEITNLKKMIELGKMPNGEKISSVDIESCIQLVILWENMNVSENHKTGYIEDQCNKLNGEKTKPLKILNEKHK